jgi:hypothetical protein
MSKSLIIEVKIIRTADEAVMYKRHGMWREDDDLLYLESGILKTIVEPVTCDFRIEVKKVKE